FLGLWFAGCRASTTVAAARGTGIREITGRRTGARGPESGPVISRMPVGPGCRERWRRPTPRTGKENPHVELTSGAGHAARASRGARSWLRLPSRAHRRHLGRGPGRDRPVVAGVRRRTRQHLLDPRFRDAERRRPAGGEVPRAGR